jgi:hypothetical protein
VHLGSFAVHNALESNLSLFDRVQEKTKADLMSQLVRIVGSLPIFGSPANMMKNIGDGVSDFFYEPSVGMKESPVGFMKGLGKGTSSLMSGVGKCHYSIHFIVLLLVCNVFKMFYGQCLELYIVPLRY